jgi:hypothetical protein
VILLVGVPYLKDMKRISTQFLLLASIVFAECSSKDPKPVNPIAPNTASVNIDGIAFPVDMKRTVAQLYPFGELRISIGTSTANGPSIALRLVEFRKRAEQIKFGSGSASGIAVYGPLINPDGDFTTANCSSMDRHFEIVEVDEKNKTVSGTFSGTVCGGAKAKTVSEGQFNIPYTVL